MAKRKENKGGNSKLKGKSWRVPDYALNAISNAVKTYETLQKEVKKNGEFTIPGFGKLVKAKRKAREGRNPATGEDAILPARRVVIFKCSGKLREKFNRK